MDDNVTPDGLEQPDQSQVDRLVNALRRPATASELSDQEAYLVAFDEAFPPRPKPLRTLVIGGRAAVVAGIAVLAAGTGAAAYTGSLPGPLQRAAHSMVGAPADQEDSGDTPDPSTAEPTGDPSATSTGQLSETGSHSPSGSPTSAAGVGPDATGPAAFGLCTAWSKGGLATTSVAYRNLATAAGGADGIAAYCATVVKPGHGSTHGKGTPKQHPPKQHPSKAHDPKAHDPKAHSPKAHHTNTPSPPPNR
jgi:hypothetical protein